jgi:hypothetical protein
MVTTGGYAPITVPEPPLGPVARAEGVEPQTLAKQGTDLQMAMAQTGPHRYRLTVVNSSDIGYINAFYWSVPSGVSIAKITSVGGTGRGQCVLSNSANSGATEPRTLLAPKEIMCEGLNLRPPTCLCLNDGGEIIISFIANAFPGYSGSFVITSATPVLKVIPSSLQPAP